MKRTAGITEEEVQRALREFRKQGKLIRRLPDEAAPARKLVGAQYSVFEIPSSGPDSAIGER